MNKTMEQTIQTLKQRKASEIHRIIAAVLEVMEKAQFEPQVDAALQQTEDPNKWKMVFTKKDTSLDELTLIKNELGKDFNVKIMPKNNSLISIGIEASCEEFESLLHR